MEHEVSRVQVAHDVYDRAFANTRFYYVGDQLGQAKLTLGAREGANRVYATTLDLIRELNEQNVWTHPTAAAATIVAGDAEAVANPRAIGMLNPSHENVESIERGLERLRDGLDLSAADVDELRAALSGA